MLNTDKSKDWVNEFIENQTDIKANVIDKLKEKSEDVNLSSNNIVIKPNFSLNSKDNIITVIEKSGVNTTTQQKYNEYNVLTHYAKITAIGDRDDVKVDGVSVVRDSENPFISKLTILDSILGGAIETYVCQARLSESLLTLDTRKNSDFKRPSETLEEFRERMKPKCKEMLKKLQDAPSNTYNEYKDFLEYTKKSAPDLCQDISGQEK